MSPTQSLADTQIPQETQDGIIKFCNTLQDRLKDNLLSISLYGSGARDDYRPDLSDVNLLILLNRIDTKSLNQILDPVNLSRRYGINPLMMTPPDLLANIKVFPIKFSLIKEKYIVLFGEDVLKDKEVDPKFLRLRCQQETQNQLMRLRHNFLRRSGGGLPAQISKIIKSYLATLRMIIFLKQGTLPSRSEILPTAKELFGLDDEVLQKAQDIQNQPEASSLQEMEALYGQFLEIVFETVQIAREMEND